jgi:polysaccharide export outer membrane protein
MNARTALPAALVVALAASGCYLPRGAYITADTLPPSGTREYTVSVGDVLQVRVFQQDAFSARVKVRADGMVSLPLVHDVQVVGKTPAALAAELQVRLKDFINNPTVTISLEELRPLSVSVMGEVARTAVVTLDTGAGVLQALAAAGGLTDFAHRDGIFVLRNVPGQATPTRIRFSWESLTAGDPRSVGFILQPGDVVVAE